MTGMPVKRFRSSDDISAAAISFSEGWRAHGGMGKIPGKSCPCSLETRRLHYGENPEDCKDLVETCGDGEAVYTIAPWSNPRRSLDENGAKTICE